MPEMSTTGYILALNIAALCFLYRSYHNTDHMSLLHYYTLLMLLWDFTATINNNTNALEC